jgi:hypothetical protein
MIMLFSREFFADFFCDANPGPASLNDEDPDPAFPDDEDPDPQHCYVPDSEKQNF